MSSPYHTEPDGFLHKIIVPGGEDLPPVDPMYLAYMELDLSNIPATSSPYSLENLFAVALYLCSKKLVVSIAERRISWKSDYQSVIKFLNTGTAESPTFVLFQILRESGRVEYSDLVGFGVTEILVSPELSRRLLYLLDLGLDEKTIELGGHPILEVTVVGGLTPTGMSSYSDTAFPVSFGGSLRPPIKEMIAGLRPRRIDSRLPPRSPQLLTKWVTLKRPSTQQEDD